MSYVAGEAKQEMPDALADAIDEIAAGLADRLEEQLLRPVQSAYGRAKQTHAASPSARPADPDVRSREFGPPVDGHQGL